jgi:recyclin-1
MTLAQQSQTLLKLLLFLSPSLQPLRDWGFLRQALLAASDRFDSTCLVAFEMADSKGDTDGMRNAAQASWGVWEAGSGTREQWECGRVWVEKREVFYETSKWDSLENIVYVRTIRLVNVTDSISKVQTPQGATVKQLDFTPMDAFISHVLEAFRADAEIAAKVFPPSARVLLSFCDRVANDVVSSEGLTSAYARLANTSTLSCRRQE